MRKAVSFAAVAVLMVGLLAMRPALADSQTTTRPVVVMSFAGYDELMNDLRFAGELGDHPGLDKNVEGVLQLFTKGRGLAGVDKTRRSGVVILICDGKPTGYAFVPVTNPNESLALLQDLGHKSQDVGDGIVSIDVKHANKRLFASEKNGWAFLSDKREVLANTPDDPAKLVAGLPLKYDGAIRLNVCNVPRELRRQFIECLREKGKKHLNRIQGTGLERAIATMVAQKGLEAIDGALNEIEQVTVGWALDGEEKAAFGEVTVTALEGTNAARQFAGLKQVKTDFSGFQLPDAAVSGSATFEVLGITPNEATIFFNAVRTAAFERIDAHLYSAQRIKDAKKFVDGMLGVAEKAAVSGRVDQGGSLVLKPDAVTLVSSRYVADGRKLEETLGIAVEAARVEYPGVVAKLLKPNADEWKGVRLHVLSIPIPERCKKRDKVVQLVGENLDIVVGFGDTFTCCAAGKNAMTTLKQVIDRSLASPDQAVRPLQFSISLSQVADFIVVVADEKHKQKAEIAARLLKSRAGKDHVTAVVTPIERGVTCRLELEEAVLQLLAKAEKLK